MAPSVSVLVNRHYGPCPYGSTETAEKFLHSGLSYRLHLGPIDIENGEDVGVISLSVQVARSHLPFFSAVHP